MRLKPVAIGLWIAVFVLGGVLVADRLVAPPAPDAPAGRSAAAIDPAPSAGSSAPAGPGVRGELPGGAGAAGATGTPVARLAPFTLADLAGQPRSSSEWAGRTVLYNFWATWCAPCRKEMPLLEQLHQGFAGPPGAPLPDPALAVVGIAIDRAEPVLRFVGEIGVTYPVLIGQMDATRVGESFGVELLGLPYSAVVGPAGDVLAIILGELKPQDLALIGDVSSKIRSGDLDLKAAKKRLASLPKARVPAG